MNLKEGSCLSVRLQKVLQFLAIVTGVLIVVFLCISFCSNTLWDTILAIRWDTIPIIEFFVLEVELWPSAFDASYLSEPITWEELDEEPPDWREKGNGDWFSMNSYTKKLLKKYMKENNLGIVPSNWPDFKFTANLEECLECFELVELY